MRGLIVPDSYRFPARPPKLNPKHPLVVRGALRMAPVCSGASMTDLFTGHVATNTNLACVNTNSGPMVVPSPGTNSNLCSLSFPVVNATETMLNITMAAIIQPMVLGGGQGFITVDASTGGDWKLQSNTTGITLVIGGSIIFGNTQVKIGHTYFCAATRATISTGQYSAVFMDMTSGVMYQNFKAGQTTSPISGATAYSMVTYNAGTAVDAGRVACGVLAATAITPDQLLAWAQDPWSLWYDPGARNLLYGSGSYVVRGPPPVPTGIQTYAPPAGFLAWDDPPSPPATSVWSAADAAANSMTLSNGGLTVTANAAGGYQTVRGTISQTSGKFYIEFNMVGGSMNGVTGDPEFGLATAGFSPLDYIGHNPISAGTFSGATGSLSPVNPSGDFTANTIIGGVFPALNDVWAIAVDLTAGKYWVAQNNVWFGSGNPAAGANPMISIVGAGLGQAYFPAMALRNGAANTGVWTLQPTAASQTYAPPAGFQAWDGGPVTPSTSVWSAADAAAGSMTLTNGGLTVTPGATGIWNALRSTTSKSSGKLYFEVSNSVAATGWEFSVGLANAGIVLSGGSGALGASNYSIGIITLTAINVSSGFTANYTPNGPDWTPPAGTVFGLAIDFTAGQIWFADNNVWTNSSNPATGSLPCVSFVPATVGPLFAAMDFNTVGGGVGVWTLQPTSASQKYAPPAGFTPWG